METTPEMVILRAGFHTSRKTWFIKKIQYGYMGWCWYDGKEYASFEECERNINLLCDTYPTKYRKG